MGFNMQCNKLLNQHNSIPQTVLTDKKRDINKLEALSLPSMLTIPTIEAKSSNRAANTKNPEFKIEQLHVKYKQTGVTPS